MSALYALSAKKELRAAHSTGYCMRGRFFFGVLLGEAPKAFAEGWLLLVVDDEGERGTNSPCFCSLTSNELTTSGETGASP